MCEFRVAMSGRAGWVVLGLVLSLTSHAGSEAWDGYVLFTPGGPDLPPVTYLQDVDGSIIQSWSHDAIPASMAYLHSGSEPGLENTLLYYPYKVDDPVMNGAGAIGGGIAIYDWEGSVLWDYRLSNQTIQPHHDIDVLPNGNILAVVWENKQEDEWLQMGRISVENTANQMWPTGIVEIEPNLDAGTGQIVWEWHVWDHLVQDQGPEFGATYASDVGDHPELMDVNCGDVGNATLSSGDWMHVNAIDYNAHLDQIVFSSRTRDEIYIIDHSTTTAQAASHSGGLSGMGGDFLYRWGNPQNYDLGGNQDHILSAPHGVNWIPEGSPGAGNIILFNNFHDGNESAALELTTPLNAHNGYDRSEGQVYGPSILEWAYVEDVFSMAQGGAYRLPNGNTLITVAFDGKLVEVTAAGERVWSYTHPGDNIMIARARKYGPDQFSGEPEDTGLSNDDTGVWTDTNDDTEESKIPEIEDPQPPSEDSLQAADGSCGCSVSHSSALVCFPWLWALHRRRRGQTQRW